MSPPSRARRRPLELLVGAAAVGILGLIAFLVTENRAALPVPAGGTRPAARTVTAPSPSASLDDLARAALSRTVTVEALGPGDEGLGTGWLLDARGDFVTNAHVVAGQLAVRLRARDGSSHVASVVGIDRDQDVAVIRSADGFPGTPLPTWAGTETSFPVPVVAVASSRATGHTDMTDETMTRIAASVPVTGDTVTGQPPTTTDYRDMLVLDGSVIYPGNSGGPVIDGTGRVVGIVTLASKSGAESYAIPLGRVLAELQSFAAR